MLEMPLGFLTLFTLYLSNRDMTKKKNRPLTRGWAGAGVGGVTEALVCTEQSCEAFIFLSLQYCSYRFHV